MVFALCPSTRCAPDRGSTTRHPGKKDPVAFQNGSPFSMERCIAREARLRLAGPLAIVVGLSGSGSETREPAQNRGCQSSTENDPGGRTGDRFGRKNLLAHCFDFLTWAFRFRVVGAGLFSAVVFTRTQSVTSGRETAPPYPKSGISAVFAFLLLSQVYPR